jgi:hypothetical protein
VTEVAGWQSRGSSSFDPRGSVDHHTAGPATGDAPSLDTIIHGRPDLAGPLANVLIARSNLCYVVAAGRANHAGSGGWGSLTAERIRLRDRARERRDRGRTVARRSDRHRRPSSRRLIRDRAGAGTVCRHAEWAPSRKIDTHDVSGDDLRRRVDDYLTQPHPNLGDVPMFCLVQPDDGRGVYRFDGAGMIGVPNPTMLGGDQIILAALGLPNTVFAVSAEWFNSWPMVRPVNAAIWTGAHTASDSLFLAAVLLAGLERPRQSHRP